MTDEAVKTQLDRMVGRIQVISEDRSQLVEDLLERAADASPLTPAEARQLIDKAIGAIRDDAVRSGAADTVTRIDEERDEVVRELLATRGAIEDGVNGQGAVAQVPIALKEARAVYPTPIFHERPIPLMSGFVPLDVIELWEGNERLTLHLEQFKRERGREPDQQELLDLMTSRMGLPGLEEEDDQFEIIDLARSIAANGIQRPPIIGLDGTLYDGNRRVAAAHFIRGSAEFGSEQKRRVEEIFVWQLTGHSDPDDVERLLMALNFEDDNKEPWPDYVKATKVTAEWRAIYAAELNPPSMRRQAELKRELSMRFALGPNTDTVNRFVKMIEVAEEFEAYLTEEREEDTSAVRHAAARYFQYFDELSKGARAGGVAWTLGQDDALRGLVFDILYEGKFARFSDIRKLKHLLEDEEAIEQLREARDMPNRKDAKVKVSNALSVAEARTAEARLVGANARVKSFTKWLRELPMGAFRDGAVAHDNIERLLLALVDARGQAATVLGEERVRELTGER